MQSSNFSTFLCHTFSNSLYGLMPLLHLVGGDLSGCLLQGLRGQGPLSLGPSSVWEGRHSQPLVGPLLSLAKINREHRSPSARKWAVGRAQGKAFESDPRAVPNNHQAVNLPATGRGQKVVPALAASFPTNPDKALTSHPPSKRHRPTPHPRPPAAPHDERNYKTQNKTQLFHLP